MTAANALAEAVKAKLADDPDTFAVGQLMWTGIREAIAAHAETLPTRNRAYHRSNMERKARLALLQAILDDKPMGDAVAAALAAAEIPE